MVCLVEWCKQTAVRKNNTLCFKHYQRFRNTGSYEPDKHYLSEVDKESATAFCEKCKGYVPINVGRVVCKASKLNTSRKSNYGVTPENYSRLLVLQNGRCAICRNKAKLYIDHCHSTGKIRGLLCSMCNLGLGHFKDSPDIMNTAIEYLVKGGTN